MLIRKLKEEWTPAEKPNLKVGEVWDYPGDATVLIREGNAEEAKDFVSPNKVESTEKEEPRIVNDKYGVCKVCGEKAYHHRSQVCMEHKSA